MIDLKNDDLDAAINAPARAAVQPPASYAPKDITEPCPKCRGTGRFVSYGGRVMGQCFTCKGKGTQSFKTSREQRVKGRAQRAQRSERKAADSMTAFIAAHPAEHAWLIADGSDFASSLLQAITKYGSLTDGQLAAVTRNIEKKAERVQAAADRVANAPIVASEGVDRLKAAFDSAIAFTTAKGKGLRLRSPRITIGGMTIKPAKAESANPGALYVNSGETYLGKIAGGKFVCSRECSDEQQTKVLSFVNDPKSAAEAYGQETGICCVCNATLTSEWRLRGIGPICAKKFGW